MSKWTRLFVLTSLLTIATLLTGGLDLPAIAIATGLWFYFTKTK